MKQRWRTMHRGGVVVRTWQWWWWGYAFAQREARNELGLKKPETEPLRLDFGCAA